MVFTFKNFREHAFPIIVGCFIGGSIASPLIAAIFLGDSIAYDIDPKKTERELVSQVLKARRVGLFVDPAIGCQYFTTSDGGRGIYKR